VPPAIYGIPPSSPLYYVTYVHVYGATPDVVYVGYTPGYYGTYVVPAGTVVYGTGYVYQPWVGSVWIGPPYTYGFGAGFAWGAATGFALGYTAGAFCHPWWGPAGWGWGWGGGSVNYNRTVNVNDVNVYNRWGGGTVVNGANHYAGHVGNTTYFGNKGGDVYADRDGNVYRRQDGSWQKYGNGGWNDADRPNTANAQGAASRAQDAAHQNPNMPARDPLAGPAGAGPRTDDSGTLGGRAGGGAAYGDGGGTDRGVGYSQGGQWGNLDRDFQARQLGDQRWGSFQQGGDRFAGYGGGDRFGGGDFGGDRFGGGFRGGFGGGGGFRGGGRR
jgi:hypothetical protein